MISYVNGENRLFLFLRMCETDDYLSLSPGLLCVIRVPTQKPRLIKQEQIDSISFISFKYLRISIEHLFLTRGQNAETTRKWVSIAQKPPHCKMTRSSPLSPRGCSAIPANQRPPGDSIAVHHGILTPHRDDGTFMDMWMCVSVEESVCVYVCLHLTVWGGGGGGKHTLASMWETVDFPKTLLVSSL